MRQNKPVPESKAVAICNRCSSRPRKIPSDLRFVNSQGMHRFNLRWSESRSNCRNSTCVASFHGRKGSVAKGCVVKT